MNTSCPSFDDFPGKKHGPGLYYFLNGDFYDGCFHKDVASGLGSYHHTNGNMYSGEVRTVQYVTVYSRT